MSEEELQKGIDELFNIEKVEEQEQFKQGFMTALYRVQNLIDKFQEQFNNIHKDYYEILDKFNKQKEVLDKIKEWKKQTLFDLNRQYKTFEYWEELFEDLDKLLEEIE